MTSMVYGMAGLPLPAPAGSFSGARVSMLVDYTLANNSQVVLAWTSEDFDTDNYHDNETNNTWLKIPTAGQYLVTATVGNFYNAGIATGRRFIGLKRNGSAYQRKEVAPTAETWIDMSVIATFSTNDYLELDAFQTTGGNATISVNLAGSGGVSYFAITRLS